jgi:glycosyltransferase involved in cell wall biosynthesis
MNNSKVSIYVPVYNGQNTIELCINSILSQTVKPDKILVINDNSTDETAKILKKYSDKIEIINNKKNLGVSYIRNLATNYLKSKFIASIDADVELSNNWLKKLLDKVNEKMSL